MTNILEFLENSSKRLPQKIAVVDDKKSYTYQALNENAMRIGSFLSEVSAPRSPVVIFMEKSVEAIACFLGTAYAGCFYVFISPEQPLARINQILDTCRPSALIYDSNDSDDSAEHKVDEIGNLFKNLSETSDQFVKINFQDAVKSEISHDSLFAVRKQALDTDPLYCNFTSGSTGTPKGVLVSHRSVIDFMNYFPDMFNIGENDVIGNQAPLDFDVSVKDIYSALKMGAQLVLIPKRKFSIIMELLDYLEANGVTTLIWAVSALCLITQLRGFTYLVPSKVNKVLFSGEAMPIKHLSQWQSTYPRASFVNLYGPTEITCNCTYFRIERAFAPDESIPIGVPFPNEKVFLLDENDREIHAQNMQGEICVAGTALALGYYRNPEQTAKQFTQNPLNPNYPETIYRTGDMGYYNSENLFCFAGRKDFQVKIMGHRIELEDIESSINAIQNVSRSCCVYEKERSRILAFYIGEIAEKDLKVSLLEKLPVYMVPSVFRRIEEFPLTANGKIDRKKLLASPKAEIKKEGV